MKETIIDYIESLGWKPIGTWNNRSLFELREDSLCEISLFEHQGDIGIVEQGKFDYLNLTKDEIKRFTEVLNHLETILHIPGDYTVKELFNTYNDLDDLRYKFKSK